MITASAEAGSSRGNLDSIPGSSAVDTRVIYALGLAGLSEAWERLAAGADSPTCQFAWTRASASTFASQSELRVFLGERAPHVTALAPLILRGRMIARLQMLAADEIYEPMDFLYSDPS